MNTYEKMREALIKARSAICEFAKYQCRSLSWENSNIQANCGDILCSRRGLCDAKTAINAALAAPPRTCDVLTKDESIQQFQSELIHYCPKELQNPDVVELIRVVATGVIESLYQIHAEQDKEKSNENNS